MKFLLCLLIGHDLIEVHRLPPTFRSARVRCLCCGRQYAQMQDPTDYSYGGLIPWEKAKHFYAKLNKH